MVHQRARPEPDDAWKQALGRRVRGLREQRGETRHAIADASQLSLRFLADVEGGNANPSLGSLYALAGALRVDVADLLERRPALRSGARTAVRSVAVLGLRGAGKSSIGKRVAKALGWGFVEVDREIEAEAGMSLAELFALHGEAHYRTLEERVLRRLLAKKQPAVLATGGGVVTHDESFRLLRAHALTVWLKATSQEHWDRVVAQGDARPMQKRSQARAELEKLYAARAPLYAQAELVIDTSALAIEDVTAEVVAALQ